MTHKSLYVSRVLLFALNINNHRFKKVEDKKSSDINLLEHTVADAFCSKKSSSTLLGHQ